MEIQLFSNLILFHLVKKNHKFVIIVMPPDDLTALIPERVRPAVYCFVVDYS
jgi:Zn-dependent M16 (insulinase) family peptidase